RGSRRTARAAGGGNAGSLIPNREGARPRRSTSSSGSTRSRRSRSWRSECAFGSFLSRFRIRELFRRRGGSGRLDSQHGAWFLVGQHVQQFVGTHADVADALVELVEQPLAAQFFELLVEQHTLDMARARNLAGAH